MQEFAHYWRASTRIHFLGPVIHRTKIAGVLTLVAIPDPYQVDIAYTTFQCHSPAGTLLPGG